MSDIDNDFGMKCPKCGASDQIDVAATVWVRLCLDGTDISEAANGDHEWNDHDDAVCGTCGHRGDVAAFTKAGGQNPNANRIRCSNCALPIPDQPEDATSDMLLCDQCSNNEDRQP
jgi:RecJ-like exonuclease